VKLLLDECIDRRLSRELAEHDVKTVPQMGWSGVKNGELLALAEKEFDVFITVDRNLAFQQSLPKFDIAVLILRVSSNRLADLKPLAPEILLVLPVLTKGNAEYVGVPSPTVG
jgi:predicted nuclease of predicted toxin-antitoxin system